MELHTYNYIKQCLEMGHSVKFIRRYGYTILFTINDLKDISFMEELSDLPIEIIPRIPKLLQPGEKCVILDTPEIKEFIEWNLHDVNLSYVIGKEMIVDLFVNGQYKVYYDDKYYFISPFMVAPVPPEENKLADVDTEEMVKELESRGLLVDGKVLKYI